MGLVSLFRKKNRKILFTTPSHAGKFFIMHKFYQWYKADISEVDAYNPEDALKKSQEWASKLYGSKSTHYLTNGSSSGVIASILSVCAGEEKSKILIWKNSHCCHLNGAKLANAEVVFYDLPFNNEWGIYDKISPENVEELFIEHKPKAIVITSPSYEGIVCDIKVISEICKKYKVYLIVDEAHGALYPFSEKLPESAIKYADFTIQSLHKTAGGLNPTALLHCNCEIDIQKYLDMITTTSPSYPMLATIEANIKFLNSLKGKKVLNKLIDTIIDLKSKTKNVEFYGDDITKILVKKDGISGMELSEKFFEEFDIEDEKTNEKSTMLLTGIGTREKDLKKLFFVLENKV